MTPGLDPSGGQGMLYVPPSHLATSDLRLPDEWRGRPRLRGHLTRPPDGYQLPQRTAEMATPVGGQAGEGRTGHHQERREIHRWLVWQAELGNKDAEGPGEHPDECALRGD